MAFNIQESADSPVAVAAPVSEAAVAARKIEGRSPWRLATRRLLHDRASMISLGVIVLIILVAIFARRWRRSLVMAQTSSFTLRWA